MFVECICSSLAVLQELIVLLYQFPNKGESSGVGGDKVSSCKTAREDSTLVLVFPAKKKSTSQINKNQENKKNKT